jgi:hypothetical protein
MFSRTGIPARYRLDARNGAVATSPMPIAIDAVHRRRTSARLPDLSITVAPPTRSSPPRAHVKRRPPLHATPPAVATSSHRQPPSPSTTSPSSSVWIPTRTQFTPLHPCERTRHWARPTSTHTSALIQLRRNHRSARTSRPPLRLLSPLRLSPLTTSPLATFPSRLPRNHISRSSPQLPRPIPSSPTHRRRHLKRPSPRELHQASLPRQRPRFHAIPKRDSPART